MVIFLIWVVFTSVYFILSEYARLTHFVYDQGVSQGNQLAISSVIELSRSCQPFRVYVADQEAFLIAMDCLSSQEDVETTAPVTTDL